MSQLIFHAGTHKLDQLHAEAAERRQAAESRQQPRSAAFRWLSSRLYQT